MNAKLIRYAAALLAAAAATLASAQTAAPIASTVSSGGDSGAGEIATANANGAPVVNAIQPDHTTYQMPDYELAPPARKPAQ